MDLKCGYTKTTFHASFIILLVWVEILVRKSHHFGHIGTKWQKMDKLTPGEMHELVRYIKKYLGKGI